MNYKYNKNNNKKLRFVRTTCAQNRDARLSLRINSERKQLLQAHCDSLGVTVNDFIDSLLGQALPEQVKDSGWRWWGDIEDIPLRI